MVRRRHEPYQQQGEDANEPDAGAKIVKVASAFDDLTEPGGPGRTAWDALEKMHLGMAYDYDPEVIQALTRVLEMPRCDLESQRSGARRLRLSS